jgi:hypothetical protein
VLVSQQATDGNYAFEYRNRRLLSHNHRGRITFTVEIPQEAAQCINLGIYLNGRKHRVFVYTRSQADDLCTNCSTWGPKRETVQPQHDVEYAVMGTGPIVILIFATERISLDVRIVVVTIKCTTVAVWRELQLSKNKNGEWVMWCLEKEGHRR